MEQAEIAAKIAELKKMKEEVKGTDCEVYSRVAGYLRPVSSWNKGKQEEYKLRKTYKCGGGEWNLNLKEYSRVKITQ